ncbi:MAG TPA: FkbM family methyltransferase [Acetobacteraceae bacterium]|nr:FkbM family methyltransferase [Acetobacteraceae bacterium]
MPPDAAAPPSHPDTAPSSRNAVRGGVLAAISTAPIAEQAAPQPTALANVAPPRGFGASLRAAVRRALLLARPLAQPFLHRLQMRMRTAVDDSSVAQTLAMLSERFATEAAASRSSTADLRALVAENARRLDGIAAKGIPALRLRLDEAHQRLDAIEQGVASVPDMVQALVARRVPIPLGDEIMACTPEGYLLLPAEDRRLLAAMAHGGVLEGGTRRALASLLPPGGAFLDVGAHVGTMTLLAARRVGERGRVFAVEPLPRLAALLRRNMAINDVADRVSVAACAAGEAEAEATLHIGAVLGESSLLPLPEAMDAGAARVAVRRVDDIVPAGTRIDVAKIDAEGAELQVWRGMRRLLEESPQLAAILEFGPSHLARAGVAPEAWLGELEQAGFAAYAIDEATGACRPTTAAALAATFSTNVLLLRPGAAARHPELVLA